MRWKIALTVAMIFVGVMLALRACRHSAASVIVAPVVAVMSEA